MIDKNEVKKYFDFHAKTWDSEMIKDEKIVDIILDNAAVRPGVRVLDVACGTGVLFPNYLGRGATVCGIDISPEMIKIAKEKYDSEKVSLLSCDIEDFNPEKGFDCVVVYNAFPHFPDPEKLIEKIYLLTNPGGTATVAHGMSKEKIDGCHSEGVGSISNGLMEAEELAALFEKYFEVTTVISDERMYQVCGRRKV